MVQIPKQVERSDSSIEFVTPFRINKIEASLSVNGDVHAIGPLIVDGDVLLIVGIAVLGYSGCRKAKKIGRALVSHDRLHFEVGK